MEFRSEIRVVAIHVGPAADGNKLRGLCRSDAPDFKHNVIHRSRPPGTAVLRRPRTRYCTARAYSNSRAALRSRMISTFIP